MADKNKKAGILLIEDDPGVRDVTRMMLENSGYRVFCADDGAAGLDLYRENRELINLAIVDMTLPTMEGDEVIRELQTANPALKSLLTSGFNQDAASERFAGIKLAGFIQKPYKMNSLMERVRGALDMGEDSKT